MKSCKNCKTENPDNVAYCTQCGSDDFEKCEGASNLDLENVDPIASIDPSDGDQSANFGNKDENGTLENDDTPIHILTKKLLQYYNKCTAKTKKIVNISLISLICIICLTIGFGFGRIGTIKEKQFGEYKSQTLNSYNALKDEYDTLSKERDTLKEEYDSYKQKMQPYESVQLADAQNKSDAEKIKLEQDKQALAKKQAAEAKAVEEKASEEEKTTKTNSLGISQSEFYTSFNGIAADNGFNAFLGRETTNGNFKTYLTLNNDVTMQTYASNDFLQTVSINAKRTTSDSLTDAAYYAVTTALVLDSSLSVSTVDSLMADLVSNASNNAGKDYSITKNGIKYTANVDNSSILFYFEKER